MRSAFLLSFVLALIPIVFLKPHVGALLWAWISFMNPHRLISWGFAYDFPFAMLIGGATIMAWLVSRERKAPPGDAITLLIIALSVWVSITTLFAIVPTDAVAKWDQTIKILIMTVITIMVIGTRERLHALVWVMVVSLGYYGAKSGVFTLLGGAEFRVWGPPKSFIADNNALSLALIMTVPLMRYLQLHSEIVWVRLGLFATMMLTFLAIVGSYSRGALLGGAAMLFVLVLRSRKRGLMLGAGLIAVLFAAAFTPQRWIDRMESITHYKHDASAQGRFDAWKFGYKLALDRPIFGGGFAVVQDDDLFLKYVPSAPTARAFHSIIFETLGEHGWIGLFLFISLLIAAVVTTHRIRHRVRQRPDLLWAGDLAAMAEVSIVGYFVTGLFLSLAYFDLYYHILVIIAVTYGIVKRETDTTKTLERTAGPTTFDVVGAGAGGVSMLSKGPSRGDGNYLADRGH